MRVTSSPQLINLSAKAKETDGLKRAYVQVIFGGDTPIEITRIIRSNNKVLYKLNGKRATRQDVIDLLLAYKSGISEVNTITQGEILRLVDLKPKERRELIDVASGIKEFEEKKDSAVKELDAVQFKIGEVQIQLNERNGYLADLERQKKEAERSIELSRRIKSASYTILKLREKEYEAQYATATSGYEEKQQKKVDLELKEREIGLKVESLSGEKNALVRKIGESSMEMSSVNQLLTEVNKQITIKEARINDSSEGIKRHEDRMSNLSNEIKGIEARKAEISSMLSQKNAELEKKGAELKRSDAGEDTDLRKAIEEYDAAQANINALRGELLGAAAEYDQASFNLSTNSGKLADINEEIKRLEVRNGAIDSGIKEKQAKAKYFADSINGAKDRLASAQKQTEELRAKISKAESEGQSLRQALATQGSSSGRISDALKNELKSGFYGRAYELCSYNDKHAMAVQASVGGRLNYFVVDSIATADKAISILKSKSLGRASFIPLDDVVINTERSNSMTPLLDFIEFDKKFSKAFEYIFSNTYLIDDVKQSKKIGLGKFRLVTLEGELVEPSGLVTGGTMKLMQSPAVIEAKLRAIEGDVAATALLLKKIDSEIEAAKKEIGTNETMDYGNNIEINILKSEKDDNAKALARIGAEASKISGDVSVLNSSMNASKRRKEELEAKLKVIEGEAAQLHDMITKTPGGQGKQRSKSNAVDVKVLREAVNQLNAETASMKTESSLLDKRKKELEAEIDGIKKDIKTSKELIAETNQELKKDKAALDELTTKIKSHDSTTAESYKRQTELGEQMQKLSTDRGKILSEIKWLSDGVIELKALKQDLQTRLSDVKAELATFQDPSSIERIEAKAVQEVQVMLAEAKHAQEALGNVNMKAIDDYAVKKKDVEEAKQRLDTLQTEKDSILNMIKEIETKKARIFMETFNTVNENFKKLYGYVSSDSAALVLDDQSDPFNSGLSIKISSKERKARIYETMAGGEKSMLMLALIFAIQTLRPMAFYVFDEIDVALDKENSKKLSSMIQQMGKNSQFVVVSHNDTLIAAADTAIGVSMRNGTSGAIGLQVGHAKGP
jgi:chromosome segregation protein